MNSPAPIVWRCAVTAMLALSFARAQDDTKFLDEAFARMDAD